MILRDKKISEQSISSQQLSSYRQTDYDKRITPPLEDLLNLLADGSYPELLGWFYVIFEKISFLIVDAVEERHLKQYQENVIQSVLEFNRISSLLNQQGLAKNLPKLSGMYAIHYGNICSLKTLSYVLHQTSNLRVQIQLINDLPDRKLCEELFSKGYPFVCTALANALQDASFTRNSLNMDDYYDVRNLGYYILNHAVKFHEDNFLLAYQQVNSLNVYKGQYLDKDSTILVAKRYWHGFFNERASGDVNLLLLWAERILITFGEKIFLLLFDSAHPNQQLSGSQNHYIELCQLLIELQEYINCESVLSKNLTVPGLVQELIRSKEKYDEVRFPEKSLEQTIIDFSTVSPFVQLPLEAWELNLLRNEYRQFEDIAKTLVSKSEALLVSEIERLKIALRRNLSGESKRRLEIEALANIRQMIRIQLKINPNITQVFSLLALTRESNKYKGRVGQIGTGEGKSIIILMLAILFALEGFFVDIITSSRPLAKRDQRRFEKICSLVNISSSHICYDYPEQSHFSGQIIYGTNYDFEFSILRDGLFDSKLRYSLLDGKLVPRNTDVAIVDEADNLFLDAANNSARLSVASPYDYSWVYSLIAEHVDKHSKKYVPEETEFENLHKRLEEIRIKQYPQKKSITLNQVKIWLPSAIKAKFELREKVNYVINLKNDLSKKGLLNSGITIVDYQNTGHLSTGSRWSDGLHEFVEMKHKINPQKEGLTAASLSHPAFFKYYSKTIALTGSTGGKDDQDVIIDIYFLSLFHAPRHQYNQLEQLPAKIYLAIAAYQEEIFKICTEKSKQGRPVLILVKTIQDSINLSEYFKAHNLLHQVLNTQQMEAEDYIIGRAGIGGVITIATNVAGRGTDILLSADVQKKGGLHVIIGFYPENTRVKIQGLGRAGRQGQKGTCQLLLYTDDDEIINLLPNKEQRLNLLSNNHFISILDDLQKQKIKQDSDLRRLHSQVDIIHHEVLKKFFLLRVYLSTLLEQLPIKKIARLFVQNQDKLCKENSSYSQEENDSKRVARNKIGLLVDSSITDPLKWEEALVFAMKAYQENIVIKWALFFTELEKNKKLPDKFELLERYAVNTLKAFLRFISHNLENSFQNIVVSYVRFILEFMNCKESWSLPRNMIIASYQPYFDLKNSIKHDINHSTTTTATWLINKMGIFSQSSNKPEHVFSKVKDSYGLS